jgi:arylsulfatase A-like enzyme
MIDIAPTVAQLLGIAAPLQSAGSTIAAIHPTTSP